MTLTIFETAGRVGSFKAAAENLSVSASAVSQAIRKLEDELGFPLFPRRNRSVVLTERGERLLRTVSEGFNSIRDSIDARRGLKEDFQFRGIDRNSLLPSSIETFKPCPHTVHSTKFIAGPDDKWCITILQHPA